MSTSNASPRISVKDAPLATQLRHAVIATLMMIAATVAALAMTPTHRLVDSRGSIDLQSIVPERFGSWTLDPHMPASIVNPQQRETLQRIYNQTLSRTYVDTQSGARIMLSIAYGEDQRDGMQVHYPEVCYPAQGFQVVSNHSGTLQLGAHALAVRRLETVLSGQRFEKVMYWTMVGDRATLGGIDKKLAEMHYSLRGDIPDGLLFRVSSIDRDSPHAFAVQTGFVRDLWDALPAASRQRLMGATE